MAHNARSFRARPLDANKPLELVRDLSLLDSTEGLPARDVVHNHAALDAENEKVSPLSSISKRQIWQHEPPDPFAQYILLDCWLTASSEDIWRDPLTFVKSPPLQPKMIEDKDKGGKEIPIPGCIKVKTYNIDYLPAWKDRYTYIRGKGGVGYDDPGFVEYDLDVEDEHWLKDFNGNQERLSPEKFELMIWKLELANAAATDRAFAFAGASLAERSSENACAATEHMLRDEALQILEEQAAARDTARNAVYDYWLAKRRRGNRPLLRRLQAPTPINDNNPYNVFRPRERLNRPQTRRRRENNEDSLDKLRMIRGNLMTALDIFETLVKRERKKRDMVYIETDMQQLQIKQRHEPRSEQEAIEQEYANAAKNKNPKRPIGLEGIPEASPAATNILLDFKNKKNKKRKKLGEVPQLNAVAQLPPPPLPPQPGAAFLVERIELSKLNVRFELPETAGNPEDWRCRVGRCGRLLIEREQPFSLEPSTPSEDVYFTHEGLVKPLWELSNPYAEWANRHELAAAAYARLEADGEANGHWASEVEPRREEKKEEGMAAGEEEDEAVASSPETSSRARGDGMEREKEMTASAPTAKRNLPRSRHKNN